MVCGLTAALISLDSCSSARSPKAMARTLEEAQYNQVYSFNDQLAPKAREFSACGALPERTHRALVQWLKESEVRPYSYARPQYFVEISKAGAIVSPACNAGRVPYTDVFKTGVTTSQDCFNHKTRTACWALCTDGRGNLTGVLAPSGKDARTLPTIGNYQLYVCTSKNKAALNEAIMASLAPYDAFRVSYRAAKGLRTLSKPAVVTQPKAITATDKKGENQSDNATDEETSVGNDNETTDDEDSTDDASDDDSSVSDDDSDFDI